MTVGDSRSSHSLRNRLMFPIPVPGKELSGEKKISFSRQYLLRKRERRNSHRRLAAQPRTTGSAFRKFRESLEAQLPIIRKQGEEKLYFMGLLLEFKKSAMLRIVFVQKKKLDVFLRQGGFFSCKELVTNNARTESFLFLLLKNFCSCNVFNQNRNRGMNRTVLHYFTASCAIVLAVPTTGSL